MLKNKEGKFRGSLNPKNHPLGTSLDDLINTCIY